MEAFSVDELRDVFDHLVDRVKRLPSDNAALQTGVEAQQVAIAVLHSGE